MQREAVLPNLPLETLSLAERAFTIISSAFNVAFFVSYRAGARRRRIGALVLTLVNMALLVESLYFVVPHLPGLDVRLQLATGVVPMIASLFITLLVLRQIINRRKR